MYAEKIIEIILFGLFVAFWVVVMYCAYKDTKKKEKEG